MGAGEVEVVRVVACPTAVIEGHATKDDLPAVIGRLIDPVWSYLRASDLVTNHNVVLYRGDMGSPEGATIEVGVQVDRPFEGVSPEGVRSSELPAARVVRAVHRGAYNQLGDTYETVLTYCRDNGHKFAGPSWEIYGDWNDDPDQLETEVAFVVAD